MMSSHDMSIIFSIICYSYGCILWEPSRQTGDITFVHCYIIALYTPLCIRLSVCKRLNAIESLMHSAWTLLYIYCCFFIQISLILFRKGPTENMSALVQISFDTERSLMSTNVCLVYWHIYASLGLDEWDIWPNGRDSTLLILHVSLLYYWRWIFVHPHLCGMHITIRTKRHDRFAFCCVLLWFRTEAPFANMNNFNPSKRK